MTTSEFRTCIPLFVLCIIGTYFQFGMSGAVYISTAMIIGLFTVALGARHA